MRVLHQHQAEAAFQPAGAEALLQPVIDYVFPDGESFRQMQVRSIAFVRSLETTHGGQTLLLVVHAGVIRALVCHFLNLDYAQHLKCKISHRYIADLSINAGRCVSYSEHGKLSGFVVDRNVSLVPGRPYTDGSTRGVVIDYTSRPGIATG